VRCPRAPWRDASGSAAVEMVLVTPLLLILLFGSVELGNFFLSEHALVKAVRDGAVYAARNEIDNFDCSSDTINPTVVSNTETLIRTGTLSGGTDRLPNWDDADAAINVTMVCVTQVTNDGADVTLSGIYTANNGLVPVITVNATVPYQPVLGSFGFSGIDLNLNASQQALVTAV